MLACASSPDMEATCWKDSRMDASDTGECPGHHRCWTVLPKRQELALILFSVLVLALLGGLSQVRHKAVGESAFCGEHKQGQPSHMVGWVRLQPGREMGVPCRSCKPQQGMVLGPVGWLEAPCEGEGLDSCWGCSYRWCCTWEGRGAACLHTLGKGQEVLSSVWIPSCCWFCWENAIFLVQGCHQFD